MVEAWRETRESGKIKKEKEERRLYTLKKGGVRGKGIEWCIAPPAHEEAFLF